jgi:hypothetical protein
MGLVTDYPPPEVRPQIARVFLEQLGGRNGGRPMWRAILGDPSLHGLVIHAERIGKAITATTARRLLANENAMIYDNPQALLQCHYKRDQALCHRDGVKDAPSLHRCVPGCANMIRIMRATSACLA